MKPSKVVKTNKFDSRSLMWSDDQIVKIAYVYLKYKVGIRDLSNFYGISKSSVDKYLTKSLWDIKPNLAKLVRRKVNLMLSHRGVIPPKFKPAEKHIIDQYTSKFTARELTALNKKFARY